MRAAIARALEAFAEDVPPAAWRRIGPVLCWLKGSDGEGCPTCSLPPCPDGTDIIGRCREGGFLSDYGWVKTWHDVIRCYRCDNEYELEQSW